MKVTHLMWLVQYALLTVVGRILCPVIRLIFSLIYRTSSKVVDPIDSPLCLMSAVELAKKIRSREITAEKVMQTYIERAKLVNRDCNFIVAERFDEALQEAQNVDRILDSRTKVQKYSPENAPFLGVPTSIKEAFALKGMPQTSGLVIVKDYKATEDAPVVRRLRQAGMIPYMVTNVSELCMWYESANRLNGRTCNPYDTARIVGGSSGGEGCAIASGAAVIGLGSDIGGSIRMPSFFNGIFGHKPSVGLVPNEDQFPLPTGKDMELLTTGPMCRYSTDLLPLLKVMSGPEAQLARLDEKVDIMKLKFFTMFDDGGSVLVSHVEPEIKQAQLRVVRYLRDTLGVQVEELKLSKVKYSFEMWAAKMALSGGTDFATYMANFDGRVNCLVELLKWLLGRSHHTLPAIGLGLTQGLTALTPHTNRKNVQILSKLDEELKHVLGSNGVLLYPTHPKVAPYHNEPIFYPFNFAYTGLFNALAYPVTQCPLGLNSEGLPLGIQIASTPMNDRCSIAVAVFLERVFGGWIPPGCDGKR
ncbi:fatty-acid amide hydrolase 2-A-like [Ostrea edulis]|uniref:fatty-acid amide hydrolase 2-A-like n=1 Tax=Ostrea edulis TaxID=37623 RepID=UPI0024AE922D|nr:fatty-acid amide hydrolase 2-A-like [Ostrea edulis]XP_048768174.2 fatty-acid amide hydrolase 2-A-like [Ostrea edulis]XP_048768175.2 fatty-acid amide hydrolase 2-A-like [Ostrea edulis]XP_048768178.2 fatty-acid amide hydrolase 2-A-like [Ostrea edulis]